MARLLPRRVLFAALCALAGAAVAQLDAQTCTPRLVGADRRGPARSISRSGTAPVLYLGTGAAVVVVDTTAVAAPVERGRVDLDELVLDVAHWQTTAIALGEHGLAFLDVADPLHPSRVGAFPFPEGWVVRRVTAREDRAYVPESNGLHVLDFTDPTAPVEIGSFAATGVRDVVLNGNRAYLLAGTSLVVLDISNPASPVQIAALAVSEDAADFLSIAGNGGRLAVFGNWVDFTWWGSAAELYSLADPDLPVLRSSFYYEDWTIEDVEFAEDRVYVSELVYDVSNLSNPVYLGALWPLLWGRDIARAPDRTHLFVADPRSGLQVADVADPAHPSIAASLAMPGLASDGYLAGSMAVVVHDHALRTYDLSDPSRPEIIGTASVPDSQLERVVRVGSHAYVTGAAYPNSSLRIFDLSDPATPHEIGSLPWFYDPPVLDGDNLFVRGDCDEALTIYDVSDPALPMVRSEIFLSSDCWEMDFTADGRRLYWWDLAGGYPDYSQVLHVYDFSNPATPIELGASLVPRHRGRSLALGRHLLLAEWDRLDVVDARVPTQPLQIGTLPLPLAHQGIPRRISSYGSLALITTTADGARSPSVGKLPIVDVSDPTAPVEVANLDTPGDARGIFAGPGLIVVADGAAGISVYESCVPFADGFESGGTAEWSFTQP